MVGISNTLPWILLLEMLLLTMMADTAIIFTYARGFTHAASINVLILSKKKTAIFYFICMPKKRQ